MRHQRRESKEASLSFLDVISCGFGAIVMLLIIARVGDPAALEETERQLQGTVKELQERLFDIRGEAVVLNEEMKSRREQLSELTDRVARLRAQLASVEKQSDDLAQSRVLEQEQLKLALQVLSEEMERLLPQSQAQNQLIGGVPVDSEYIIFVIDTSGSMQMAAWQRVQTEMINILNIYPTVKGIQVMNDNGQYMFSNYRGRWMPDSPDMRRQILNQLRNWAPFSNSSPVEGINAAIQTFYRPDRKISIYTLGDDFSGRSIRRVVKAVDNLNQAQRGADRLVRIHAIGFPVHFPPGRTPSASAVKFAALMRELSYNNGGTFIGLTSLQP
ncbi:MAG: VWA domain-containing protein [Xanthomonadales bacterium]|nr:VWA domain-containing protein [Xanthomonadales bacterium]NIN58418.1 VWA domain-containing protein [Xanthomonadales bacterium]NIN73755.1 VWA domain-containing protein [Xanthomonadales bacterium]NIO13725.1 VWA domain-containing protein [Xanthomonadales bacterium]NIP10811.1 VWA domain-containing protein [Xanthomonadales bacterium]